MIKDAIRKVVEGQNLARGEAVAVMTEIMSGEATDAQISAVITGLRMKGETIDEISGFAEVMREKALRINPKAEKLIDTCGTGGDLSHTFNISTTTAFVVSGAGLAVAKHGNRSVSSSCGSADLLETLGVKLDIEPDAVADAIDNVGIGFLFAPALHKAMKYAIGPRKEIAIRTVFNILGPLTNPAKARFQILGVYDPGLTDIMAQVLSTLGTQGALVVHGSGLDEMTTTGETKISQIKDGQITSYTINPEDIGLEIANAESLVGGSSETNAKITKDVLAGQSAPARDIVLLNASGALVAANEAKNFEDGLEQAARSIDSGNALSKLEALVDFTNSR